MKKTAVFGDGDSVLSIKNRGLFVGCILLVVFIKGINSKPLNKNDLLTPFELSSFLDGSFAPRSWNGSWVSGDSFIYKSSNGDGVLYSMSLNKPQIFISEANLAKYPGASFSLSPDHLFVLLKHNVSSVFRHSTTALYSIYDISNNIFYNLAEGQPIQLAQWCPNGHGIIYVYLNNIYYLPDIKATNIPIQLTYNGIPGIIYNGVPDWVYEEEVLGSGSAIWISPNGNYLAFATFDDTNVKEFSYPIYGIPGSLKDQYPTLVTIRYPKVGTPNPNVNIFFIDLTNPVEIIPVAGIHPKFLDNDYIFYGITWITNKEFSVLTTNRVQNQGELLRCHISAICIEETSYKSNKGWLEFGKFIYSKNGNVRFEILPQPEDNDYFDHIVMTNTDTKAVIQLTKGKYHVIDLYEYDNDNGVIYYSASVENFPSQKHVYTIDTKSLESKCLSCNIKSGSTLCKYASAKFSKDLSYITIICSGPGPTVVQVTSTKSKEYKEENPVLVWEDNADLVEKLSHKLQPVIQDLNVPLSNGFTAKVRLLLPPGLNKTQKYPTIVNVYAGPNSNQIMDKYKVGFENYLITSRHCIYVYIDGRGSGLDGKNKQLEIYRKLGTVEIEDQIFVTKYLQKHYQFIDENRTGIWGWSYGGFATTWALIKDHENIFKCGIAVAPVTDFIYYDSIYTERYMGLPSENDNLAGYNNTDITRQVRHLAGKSFFLIHGTGDDNVHYQQSLLLSKALEYADIPFRQQSYTDETHSLTHVSPHLYHTMDRFWGKCLGTPPSSPTSNLKSEKLGR